MYRLPKKAINKYASCCSRSDDWLLAIYGFLRFGFLCMMEQKAEALSKYAPRCSRGAKLKIWIINKCGCSSRSLGKGLRSDEWMIIPVARQRMWPLHLELHEYVPDSSLELECLCWRLKMGWPSRLPPLWADRLSLPLTRRSVDFPKVWIFQKCLF